MNNIVLIGMPGAGKSTIGVLLAKALKRPFLDTDLLIQTHTGRFLQEIIDADGLEAFLDLEARVIRELNVTGHVIATGGSVVYRDSAMAHLRRHGYLLYISLPLAIIEARIRNITTRGIVRHPGQPLQELFDERHPLYLRYADLVLDAAGLSPEDTVHQAMRLLLDVLPDEVDRACDNLC